MRGARYARDVFDGGKLFDDLGEQLKANGVDVEAVAAQIERLRWSSNRSGFGVKEAVPPEQIGGDMVRPDWQPDDYRHGDIVPTELLGKFAVSMGRKSGHRCLHLLGSCHRAPELHHKDYDIFDERPEQAAYHAVCQQCWPSPLASGSAASTDPDEEDSSSSDEDERAE